jgi:alanine racemase
VTGSITTRLAAAGLPPLPRLAWLELDLDALRANLAVIRALAGPGVAVHPVVKADAYGHGAMPIARALVAAGIDGLCVATADEALELRSGGIAVPLRVLYPVPEPMAAMLAGAHVTVASGDVAHVHRMAAALAGVGRPPLGVELEVDTGLGRGGVTPDAVVAVAGLIGTSPDLVLAGLWTHLQAVEDPALTALQVRRFEAVAATLRAAGHVIPALHLAASAGILTGVAPGRGVRPGLALYGIVPDELSAAGIAVPRAGDLRPVMALHAQPVRVAALAVGDGVGYGPTWRAARPSVVATLPLGYGDGYARAHSNRGHALVRGLRVPIVGNVAMDAVMVDVTDLPGPPVTVDDAFVLLGAQDGLRITADELARQRTTNTWEVVTAMSGRLPRVYHSASGPVELRTLAR